MRPEPWAGLALAFGLVACTGDDVADGGDPAPIVCTEPLTTRYQPLVVGATWTYDISEPLVPPRVKTSTIEALEDVGDRKAGVVAFRQRSEKLDGVAISWHEDRCTHVIRHREQSYDPTDTLLSDQFYVPGKLRVDETKTTMGMSWVESYTEVEIDPVLGTKTVSKDETWIVEAVDEPVTVMAGTFSALRVRKTTTGLADKTYWFVKGVGKVREQGEQLEELRTYSIP